MLFRELDPATVRALLEETNESGQRKYQDLLTPEATKEQAFFRNSPCPKCGEIGHESFVDSRRPFVQGALLPNCHLRCLHCRTEFDPHTGLVLKARLDESE